MKLFIDSANIADIREFNDYGVLGGVEVHLPSIVKQGRAFASVIPQIAEATGGVIFAGVVSPEHKKMVIEARELTKLGPKIAVQIPMCPEGLRAIKALKNDGVHTGCTFIFSAAQALLAALAGAAYVNVPVGVLEGSGINGAGIIAGIAEIFGLYGFTCEIAASGLQSPMQAVECAKAGAHIAVVSSDIIRHMMAHPLTADRLEQFTADSEEMFALL